ncbi:MAG: thioesterase family protein [Hyphomicrobiales bacterium]|nr:thioesterase family protein [Hyphomicrobiales bacterium]
MSEAHPFDRAIALTPDREGLWRGATSAAYANMAGPFGGIVAAQLLNAVMLDQRRLADPIALTVNFCGAISDGAFEISTRLVRGGKNTQHWSVELAQNGATAATASVVCGVRRPTWTHLPTPAPKAPHAKDVPVAQAGPRPGWTNRYDMRFVEGDLAPFPRADGVIRSARSLVWLQDNPARPLDFPALAALSDTFFVRIMHVRGTFQPMATVSMTTYFHVGGDELARIGAAPLLGDVDGDVFHDCFADQTCALWSADGRLVANGVQATWFKE